VEMADIVQAADIKGKFEQPSGCSRLQLISRGISTFDEE